MENEKIYKPRLKVFKERAERIPKLEYDKIVGEIIAKFGSQFEKLEPAEPLHDKDGFGDIDFIIFKF